MKPIRDVASNTCDATLTRPHDHDRQCPIDRRMLHVLGFGLAGAILANALVLACFLS